ncbi:MAG: hypothetical protein KIT80_22495 [Chitinophagaceae bacterium]|nr:hypothetical protein [Chitinophagaceae bacterium]MCW5929706.1 hypothetical protein [Chitinophagaceae bacterium]
MRPILFIVTLLFFASCSDKTQKSKNDQSFKAFIQKTRLVDTSFISTVKLNDIIVCSSTITDIKQKGYTPVLTPKEQIDSLIAAVNWQDGEYYYDKTTRLIFCTYDYSELLSSIFLKDNFSGTLRELPIADFSKITVRDITAYFKDLDWSITGVSDYWIYGNDTVNFYIKVDKSIPRFPLDEKFYEDKHPVLAKVQFLCSKIYGDVYTKNDTVMQKPLYAPFSDTHLNYYLLRRKPGIGTTIKEITSTGKKTNMEEIRIGKWLTYNPDHTLKSLEYYNDGKVVRADK